ncbi:hypothetical protein M885DRAFT_619727 [Pelagophyceae sp. CCMP2097]|nr:hypothetical protein M885DRAFT_619727 [Pelagophyceae sp. CCMP2097]
MVSDRILKILEVVETSFNLLDPSSFRPNISKDQRGYNARVRQTLRHVSLHRTLRDSVWILLVAYVLTVVFGTPTTVALAFAVSPGPSPPESSGRRLRET